ncbi:hypothetical protein [Bifidobacterium platyrrhinorum]|uniref:Uncharacterized protein n=1 Tax=Bifidobacterium platyrrhinorum TaxID=2661628 RepID=A0A6L9SSQ2_9BIFI|nr:hypothetical protein [Bifidobacterium platyrrhinorum]NEG55099.1 hypothetical protein [Bifidobacterium platyrrhinorum]
MATRSPQKQRKLERRKAEREQAAEARTHTVRVRDDRASRGQAKGRAATGPVRPGMTRHGEFTVVITQMISYALLFGIVYTLGVRTPGGIIGSGMLAASATMMMIFGWPFGGSDAQSLYGRMVAAVTFVVAGLFVIPSEFYVDSTYLRWAAFLVIAALLIAAVSFLWTGRAHAKGDEDDYVRIGLESGCTSLAGACWIFLPALFSDMMTPEAASATGWAVFAVLVVAAVVLLRLSTKRWNALEHPGPYSWMGTGMVPVMRLGLLVFLAACATHWLM